MRNRADFCGLTGICRYMRGETCPPLLLTVRGICGHKRSGSAPRLNADHTIADRQFTVRSGILTVKIYTKKIYKEINI